MIDQCANEVIDMFKKLNFPPDKTLTTLFGEELSAEEMEARINFSMITAKHNLSGLEVVVVAKNCVEQIREDKNQDIKFNSYNVTKVLLF